MIFARIIPAVFIKWIWAAGIFLGGWALLFLGHRMGENRPAFFQGLVYSLVGPIWVAKEAWMFITGSHRKPTSEGTTRSASVR